MFICNSTYFGLSSQKEKSFFKKNNKRGNRFTLKHLRLEKSTMLELEDVEMYS